VDSGTFAEVFDVDLHNGDAAPTQVAESDRHALRHLVTG
jgi:hypothetical protein